MKGPDGMRAANGKLIIPETATEKYPPSPSTERKASVTVLKHGLKTPIGVEPAGDTLWIAE